MRRAASRLWWSLVLALAGCNDKKTAEAAGAARAHGERNRQLLRHERAGALRAPRGRSSWRAGSSRSGSRPRATRCRSRCCPRSRRTSARSMSPTWRRRRAGRSPAPNNWVDAKQALFVVGSRIKGGMGADEAVPFSDREAADRFATENGGRVLAFAEVPRDYVLGAGRETTSSVEETPSTLSAGPGAPHAGSKAGHEH